MFPCSDEVVIAFEEGQVANSLNPALIRRYFNVKIARALREVKEKARLEALREAEKRMKTDMAEYLARPLLPYRNVADDITESNHNVTSTSSVFTRYLESYPKPYDYVPWDALDQTSRVIQTVFAGRLVTDHAALVRVHEPRNLSCESDIGHIVNTVVTHTLYAYEEWLDMIPFATTGCSGLKKRGAQVDDTVINAVTEDPMFFIEHMHLNVNCSDTRYHPSQIIDSRPHRSGDIAKMILQTYFYMIRMNL